MRIRLLILLAALTSLTVAPAFGAPILFDVNPKGTYLPVDGDSTGYLSPLFINLSTYGFTPGMTIAVQTLGDFKMCQQADPYCVEQAWPLGAIFSDLGYLNPADPSTLRYRVSSIAAIGGDPIGVGVLTYPHNNETDTPHDFAVPTGAPALITIPTGANYLVVGVIDSWYDDNTDPNGNLKFSIEEIPEPGTLMLLVPGLGLLLALRRRQKS